VMASSCWSCLPRPRLRVTVMLKNSMLRVNRRIDRESCHG
jgi:hypothetical protein